MCSKNTELQIKHWPKNNAKGDIQIPAISVFKRLAKHLGNISLGMSHLMLLVDVHLTASPPYKNS